MKADLLDVADVPIAEQPAGIERIGPEAPAALTLFERLARDPNVPVEKLEKLIAMQERINAHNAKAEFDAAFSAMQGEIPIITERGEILINGQLRSKYAKLEDILSVVKPIMQKHGFAIRHRNEFTDGKLKIIGILSHRSGHSEQDEFVTDADTGAGRNAIQSLGSARSYGQRYTVIALLGIATRGADDDGASSEKAKQPDAPEGYEPWLAALEAVTTQGEQALREAWNQSKPVLRNYLTKWAPQTWAAMKAKAGKVVTP